MVIDSDGDQDAAFPSMLSPASQRPGRDSLEIALPAGPESDYERRLLAALRLTLVPYVGTALFDIRIVDGVDDQLWRVAAPEDATLDSLLASCGGWLPGGDSCPELGFAVHGAAPVDVVPILLVSLGVGRARLDHDLDRMSRDQAARFANSFRAVVGRLMDAAPGSRIGDLAGAGPLEEETRERWSRGPGVPIAYDSVIHWFDAIAPEHARRVAVDDGERSFSYDAFGRMTRAGAAALAARGVGPGAVVGLCTGRSIETMAAMFAVMRLGAAYLPLPPDWPRKRLATVTEHARPDVVLTDEDLAGLFVGDGPAIAPAPDALAYILYTSGSTGRPKGVSVGQRSLVNHLQWFVRTFETGTDTRMLLRTSFAFDACVFELFGPLVAGGTVVLATDRVAPDLEAVSRLMRASAVTELQLVPTMLGIMLESGAFDAMPALIRTFAGGEPLPPDLVARIAARIGVPVANMYGPTEATVVIASAVVAPDARVTPVGRPVDNTELTVRGTTGALTPIGVPGELWISGEPLARGYHNAESQEGFVEHPDRPGERAYRSGDIVRWLDDGQLQHLGRADRQVKVRGQRVELDEVELALAALPGVRAAAVLLDNRHGGALRGFVVADDAPGLSARLRQSLAERLTTAMTPATITVMAAFPTLPNGKLDRAAIAAAASPKPMRPPAAIDPDAIARRLTEARKQQA